MIAVTQGEQLMAVSRHMRLRLFQPRFLALPEANALLGSIDNDCRHSWRSRLLRTTDRGTAALYESWPGCYTRPLRPVTGLLSELGI